jgi:hypothetical protein
MSESGQGRLWPAGGWHSRSTQLRKYPRVPAFTLRAMNGHSLGEGSKQIPLARPFSSNEPRSKNFKPAPAKPRPLTAKVPFRRRMSFRRRH